MTNRDLIVKWRELKIKFKSEKKSTPMMEMFLVCVGETEIDVQGQDKLERVVGFYQGFDEKGSPAVLFSTDKKNTCFTYGLDTKNNKHVKANIGVFVKNE